MAAPAQVIEMPLERIASLEAEVRNIKELLDDERRSRAQDVARLEAHQENIARTIENVAGLLRDQKTEERIREKWTNRALTIIKVLVAGGVGWIIHWLQDPKH